MFALGGEIRGGGGDLCWERVFGVGGRGWVRGSLMDLKDIGFVLGGVIFVGELCWGDLGHRGAKICAVRWDFSGGGREGEEGEFMLRG